jgi:6-phosphogluconolactonase (cycloisomerase 2 family)
MFQWLSRTTPKARPNRRRVQLGVEPLEDRAVPSTLASLQGSDARGPAVVYTETNNPQAGDNAVLAYRRDAHTGELKLIGTFPTGGTGQLNVPKLVGPDDGDQQVQATPDGKFLYAVNEGSHSVTAFRIGADGKLDWLATVDSGGTQPDTIGITGSLLYVGNRGDAAAGVPGTVAPSVTGFTINGDGSLSPIANSTVAFPINTFVTQTLTSRDGRFLFVEAATLDGTAGGNTVTTFQINSDGTLTAAPGGPASAGTNAPVLLGAARHPFLNIVYAGFASSGQVGVFTYDETGRTSFVTAAQGTGAAPCWCVVSADGRVLYAANTASDSIGVYSLADPLHPVQIQEFKLGGPRAWNGAKNSPKALVFEIALDPTGRFLYAVDQASDPSFPQGNQLHTLRIASDGTLSEPLAPVVFDTSLVPANAHPQGLAAVSLRSSRGDGDSGNGDFGGADFGGADSGSFGNGHDDWLAQLFHRDRR